MQKLIYNSENPNGILVDMTAEELAQRETDKANALVEQQAKQARIDAEASGNQKLLDLGLSQAEATALTGYTPPVAE